MRLRLRNVLLLLAFVVLDCYSVTAQSVSCPAVRTTSGWLDLFPLPCKKNKDCGVMGASHLCCKGYCTKGVKAAAIRTDQPASSVPVESSSSSTTTTTTTPSTTSSTTSTTSTTTTTTSTTTTTTPSTTSSTTTTKKPTTTSRKPTTTEPPRPFLNILPIQTTKAPQAQKAQNKNNPAPAKAAKQPAKLVCPKPGRAPVVLFPIPCEKTSQCRGSSGPDQVCCEGRCVKGVPAPKPKVPAPTHQPLLGVIPRECPSAPLGELLFEVQSCKSDADCWPRVCCPDGKRSYCRTARARLDLVPIANQIDGPVRSLEKYLQCTPPPQYDLFPKACTSPVDCFPNLCCAEGGKRHCRPPQRSLLALLAGVGQRVGTTIGNFRQARANANNNKNE